MADAILGRDTLLHRKGGVKDTPCSGVMPSLPKGLSKGKCAGRNAGPPDTAEYTRRTAGKQRTVAMRASRSKKEATIAYQCSGGELNPGPRVYGLDFEVYNGETWFGWTGYRPGPRFEPGPFRSYRGRLIQFYLNRAYPGVAFIRWMYMDESVMLAICPPDLNLRFSDLLRAGDIEPNPGPVRKFKHMRSISADDYIKAKVPKCRYDGDPLTGSYVMLGRCAKCGVFCERLLGEEVWLHPFRGDAKDAAGTADSAVDLTPQEPVSVVAFESSVPPASPAEENTEEPSETWPTSPVIGSSYGWIQGYCVPDAPQLPHSVPVVHHALNKAETLVAGVVSERLLRKGHRELKTRVTKLEKCLRGYRLQTEDELRAVASRLGCPTPAPFSRMEISQTFSELPYVRDQRIAANRNVKQIEESVEIAHVTCSGRTINWSRVSFLYTIAAISFALAVSVAVPMALATYKPADSVCYYMSPTLRLLVPYVPSSVSYYFVEELSRVTFEAQHVFSVVDVAVAASATWCLAFMALYSITILTRRLWPNNCFSSVVVSFKETLSYVPHALTSALCEYRPGADIDDIEQKLLRQASLPIPDELYLQLQRGTAVAAQCTSDTVQRGFRAAHDYGTRVVSTMSL